MVHIRKGLEEWSTEEVERILFDPNVSDYEEEDEDLQEQVNDILEGRIEIQEVIDKLLQHDDFDEVCLVPVDSSVTLAQPKSPPSIELAEAGRCGVAGPSGLSGNRGKAKRQREAKTKPLKWSSAEFIPPPDLKWKCSLPPPPLEDMSPLDYFRSFFDNKLLDHIALETNKYALQKNGEELGVTRAEIEMYIGILIHMGIVPMPQVPLYWSKPCRYPPVADVMSRNRFEKIKQYFHLNDNTLEKKRGDAGYDKLFKIRPLIDHLLEKFNEIPGEELHSIDEQMIPFKGRSFLKQYNKSKPHKWGFKVFTRTSSSGIMHNIRIYVGEGTCDDHGLGISSIVVIELTKNLPSGQNFKVFFDNWFSSIPLCFALREGQIWSIGTIRADRIGHCPLKKEADLKKEGRGSMDSQILLPDGSLNIVRWYDSKAINLISSYCSIQPINCCKRFDQKLKKHIEVERPNVVKEYNAFMGGVDLMDMLVELYRIDVRSTKWYSRILLWSINISVGWLGLLYRRHCKQKGLKPLPLLTFMSEIAHGLTTAYKPSEKRKRGRPSAEETQPAPKKRRLVAPNPVKSVRFDHVDHMPEFSIKKNRCRVCQKTTTVYCPKCNVHLCFTPNRNCAKKFHSSQ
ncbi:Hypothetical protein NTJ_02426 [Nesidiocoris tenuis]|uniref:PiggyBac transposable element-derived protein domain-containing protein n=1 Tax=Nesidiocoris tenuis TaxID=355587 RepID=A0ABN7ABB8_9HEMI|nr:Hypothetical protein NTJ_02426 [Nesidiocoris tenuis]